MNINTILGIIFFSLVVFGVIYFLYANAENQKRLKLKIVNEKNKKNKEQVIKYQSNDLPESGLNKDEVKKKIIIKKENPNNNPQKDIVSEAINEIGDFEQIKENILNGQKNMTNIADVEPDYSPTNILVVDDSRVFRRKTTELLISLNLNYEITTAINGEDALIKLKADKNKFDLIITDMDMPKMDGGELINLVKKDVVLHNIPIIVITGKPKLISNGLEDKVEGVLEKPYKDEDLIYQTKSVLSA
jgi:CheY-like chemotaxis protein